MANHLVSQTLALPGEASADPWLSLAGVVEDHCILHLNLGVEALGDGLMVLELVDLLRIILNLALVAHGNTILLLLVGELVAPSQQVSHVHIYRILRLALEVLGGPLGLGHHVTHVPTVCPLLTTVGNAGEPILLGNQLLLLTVTIRGAHEHPHVGGGRYLHRVLQLLPHPLVLLDLAILEHLVHSVLGLNILRLELLDG